MKHRFLVRRFFPLFVTLPCLCLCFGFESGEGQGLEDEGERSRRLVFLVPVAGMSVAGSPTETNQSYGLHVSGWFGPRWVVEGWARGNWSGSRHRGGVVGGDLLFNLAARPLESGGSILAGVSRWSDRTAFTVGFRARGGALTRDPGDAGEGSVPPVQLWLEARGGLAGREGSDGEPNQGVRMLCVFLALPIPALG